MIIPLVTMDNMLFIVVIVIVFFPQELPVGSLLYGRPCEDSESAQLKTRQGRVNRYEGGAEAPCVWKSGG